MKRLIRPGVVVATSGKLWNRWSRPRVGPPWCFASIYRDCSADTCYLVFGDGSTWRYDPPGASDGRILTDAFVHGELFNDAYRRPTALDENFARVSSIPGTAVLIYQFPPYAGTDPGPCPIPAHLGAYWTMEEAGGPWVDSVGGYVLSNVPNPSSFYLVPASGPGIIGSGLQLTNPNPFAGGGSIGVTGGPGVVVPNPGGASLWFWWMPQDANGSDFALRFTVSAPTPWSIGAVVTTPPDNLNFAVSNVGTTDTGFVSAVGVWFFVAMVWDVVGGTMDTYVNGALFNSVSMSEFTDVSSGPAVGNFGLGPFGGGFPPSDTISVDEVGLSVDGALSAAQVAALYNGGAGVTWPGVAGIVPT